MKQLPILLLFLSLFSANLIGQHLNVNFDIDFSLNKDTITLADEFDIEGEVTNISSSVLTGDIYLDYYVGTTIPSGFFNNIALADTIAVSGSIQPGDDFDFEMEEIEGNDARFGFQANQHNIIIIWPRLAPSENGSTINYFVDTLFVLPDTSNSVSNENVTIQPLKLYPNPITESNIYIDLADLNLEPYYLTVWNNLGQKLLSDHIIQGGQINELSVAGFPDGVAVVQLFNKDGIAIKQKRILLQSTQH